VWFQTFEHVGNAIARETEIKAWRREKKVALIRENNPTWEDLAEGSERVGLSFVAQPAKSRFLTAESRSE
jgi:putative endonuclease